MTATAEQRANNTPAQNAFLDLVEASLAAKRANRAPVTPVNTAPIAEAGEEVHTHNGRVWALAALEKECEELAVTPEGSRNDALNRSAFRVGQLIAPGQITQEEALAALALAAERAGLPVWEIGQVLRVHASASPLSAGQQAPRGPAARVNTEPVGNSDTLEQSGNSEQFDHDSDSSSERARSTWWPLPLTTQADNAAAVPPPEHLLRSDGVGLIYAGKVNAIIGESESGKTWIALLALVQAIQRGQRGLVLDFEDSPATVLERLALLGATAEQLARVDYARPDEALGALQAADIQEAIATGYGVVVVDGVNALMSLLGLSINDNGDATVLAVKVLDPLAKYGAAVITVDHVPKSSEARGKGGIGAQAKRASLTGCALRAEVVKPFGRGLAGEIRLTVDKDRAGRVRGIAGGGTQAGLAKIESGDSGVTITIEPPSGFSGDDGNWEPTRLMGQISDLLIAAGEPLTGNAIVEATQGRRSSVLDALQRLIAGRFVDRLAGPRGSFLHRSIRPYIGEGNQ